MIDQSFSPQNIEAVFDAENKRGTNIERLFESTFERTITLAADMKALRKQIRYETDISTRRELIDVLNNQQELRKEQLSDIFGNISNNLKTYTPAISVKQIKSMTCYNLNPTVESYFYSKILQRNLRETYKVKQQSRYHILKSIIHFISDRFPKIVIRTDVKQFYESIPQKQLLKKLASDHLITVNTRRGISKILDSFNNLRTDNNDLGLPRGIGISAYLSEIYMESIDIEIKKMDDLVYYARYVDDIIAIFIPGDGKRAESKTYISKIEEIFNNKSENHLKLSSEKTQTYDLQSNLTQIIANTNDLSNTIPKTTVDYDNAINYLGYIIGFSKKIELLDERKKESLINLVDISDKKVLHYKSKIKLAFDHFNKKKHHNPSNSFKLLESRLRYLLTNTRLSNNKSNVFVGLYYSYPFISSEIQLQKLDNSLLYYIGRTGLSNTQKEVLKKLSFNDYYKRKELTKHCFNNKRYKTHNTNQNDIINVENKGVLKFGIKEITSIWK